MSEDPKHIAESIRNGTYFDQARAWYQTLYIGPIAERTFFIIIASLSGIVAFFSIISVFMLMPLTDKPGLLLNSPRPDEIRPTVEQIVPHGEPINQGIREFFVRNYVSMREAYSVRYYEQNYNFVREHSDPATFTDYDATYGRANPRSPVSILGERGTRKVFIESINAGEDRATVVFSTELTGVETGTRSRWTATLQYHYTDLVTTFETDPKTGRDVMKTQDPQFQVTNYVLTQL